MKKLLMLPLLLAAFALAGTAAAGHGHGNTKAQKQAKPAKKAKGPKSKKEYHFGPFASASTDGGSCGNEWANDTADRTWKVRDNGDGTFRVREEFKKGKFTTIAGQSPGACDTDGKHGSTVNAGVKGKFHGFLKGTVTSSTFNPNGCSAAGADCSTTQGFLNAVFGLAPFSSAFTCNAGFVGCDFNFEYSAKKDQGLIYHHWQDTEKKNAEVFRGDIANA